MGGGAETGYAFAFFFFFLLVKTLLPTFAFGNPSLGGRSERLTAVSFTVCHLWLTRLVPVIHWLSDE